jgi:hypothetical protein
VGTVSLRGVLGDIVSFSFGVTGDSPEFGDKGNSPELEDFNGNLNLLRISFGSRRFGTAYRSNFPSASGFGLFGLGASAVTGRLAFLTLSSETALVLVPLSPEAFLETVGRSNDPFLDVLPMICGPTILILAIVSGEGERRKTSADSRIGDEGAEEVNGNDDLLRGSGRLNGAGAGSAAVICGTGGSR